MKFIASCASSEITNTSTVLVVSSSLAVITARPISLAVTSPLSTVAIPLLLEVHSTVALSSVVEVVAISSNVSATCNSNGSSLFN